MLRSGGFNHFSCYVSFWQSSETYVSLLILKKFYLNRLIFV